jgi:hypothetical protein
MPSVVYINSKEQLEVFKSSFSYKKDIRLEAVRSYIFVTALIAASVSNCRNIA